MGSCWNLRGRSRSSGQNGAPFARRPKDPPSTTDGGGDDDNKDANDDDGDDDDDDCGAYVRGSDDENACDILR